MNGSPGSARLWARDLGFGVRFAVSGGKEGWVRTVLTAVGVGLGVAMLLLASSLPAMMAARQHRDDARTYSSFGTQPPRGAGTLLISSADTTFGSSDITGLLVKADGPKAPAPPGLTALPRPGDMAVSPALARLLAAPGNGLLRRRLDYRQTAVIGEAGLSGPAELYFYAGNSALKDGVFRATRIDHFGEPSAGTPLDPALVVLVVVTLVILLVPVGVFIATAVRFGGERRDRRLAALRLVGADRLTTHRIAAGESAFGSLIGLLVGAGIFLSARQFIGSVSLYDLSVFPSDVTPGIALTVLVAVAVPASAIAVTLLALRRVVIEPLGVVRDAAGRRRRLWWRLVMPLAGAALLYPLFGAGGVHGTTGEYQIAGGVTLLLIGLTALLPWLVEAVVLRLGGGGPVPWQLACRRLQLAPGSAARMVGGITVAVAGAIAAMSLFGGVQSAYTHQTGQDPRHYQMFVDDEVHAAAQANRITAAFRATPGVTSVLGVTTGTATTEGAVAKERARAERSHRTPEYDIPLLQVTVADCASLERIARMSGCHAGSVFLTRGSQDVVHRGERLDLNTPDFNEVIHGAPRLWTVPRDAGTASAETVATDQVYDGVLATPQALDAGRLTDPIAQLQLRLDPHNPRAADEARDTAIRFDPTDPTTMMTATDESNTFTGIERGLLAGSAAVLLMIGASLLVSMLEQLRERKRLLAVLVAFGVRRTTLGLSVLWQTAVPVVLGLVLAVAGGVAVSSALLKVVNRPVVFDWSGIATLTGLAAAVVLVVTLLSLPPLWRMMRPDGLRTE